MRLKVVIEKNFDAFKEIDRFKKAVTKAAKSTERGAKTDLRQQIVAAGLGTRLSNTWRGHVYPKSGESMNAAVSIVSKAPHIIESFDEGVVIRARNKRYLAIPTEFAPKSVGGKKRQMTPENFTKQTGIELFLIERPGKNALLVAKGVRITKAGRVRALSVRKAGKTMGTRVMTTGHAWVPMFTLVPQARMKKKLSVEAVLPKWQDFFVEQIEKNMKNAD